MPTPYLHTQTSDDNCFVYDYPGTRDFPAHLFFGTPTVTDRIGKYNRKIHVGRVAGQYVDGSWAVIDVEFTHSPGNSMTIQCVNVRNHVIALAAHLDPGLTESDINGAIAVQLNPAGDGWVFRHTNAGTHQDHLIAVESGIAGKFQQPIDAALGKVMQAIAAGSTSRVVTSAAVRHANLREFRNDVIALALAAEKSKHLGHFHQNPHPELGHVHDAIAKAVSAAKVKWAASPEILARYRTIADRVTPIIADLAAPHEPEMRLVQLARLKAERAAGESES